LAGQHAFGEIESLFHVSESLGSFCQSLFGLFQAVIGVLQGRAQPTTSGIGLVGDPARNRLCDWRTNSDDGYEGE